MCVFNEQGMRNGIAFYQGKRQRRQWHPTPVLLPGKSHGWRSLVGCSPWGHQESDTTERLHFHFSLSCSGEGNGNPLQCSHQENPRDGGAWWAAVYGVAQSWTRLKRLSSSSSSRGKESESVLELVVSVQPGDEHGEQTNMGDTDHGDTDHPKDGQDWLRLDLS